MIMTSGCAWLLGEPLGFGVKKWYFLKRRGRGSNPGFQASVHSSTPHLAFISSLHECFYFALLTPQILELEASWRLGKEATFTDRAGLELGRT